MSALIVLGRGEGNVSDWRTGKVHHRNWPVRGHMTDLMLEVHCQ